MEKLIIGIDLCDTYTQAAVLGREETWILPTVICRKKTKEEWWIGEEAFKYTLVGEGVDSLIFFPVAFGGVLPWSTVLQLIIAQMLLKTAYEIIILPVTIRVVRAAVSRLTPPVSKPTPTYCMEPA